MNLGISKIVPMSDILFDESTRGRVDYGDIKELAQSIKEQGLINPLTVYCPSLEPPYELIAGGRRYKALQLLGAAMVSVRIYDHELSDRERKVIELFENLRRKELSFIERANMTNMLDETLKAMHGPKLPGPTTMGHSTRNTARLLGVSQQSVNNDIKLAQANKHFPELALGEKKNASSALHAVKRLEYTLQSRISNPEISTTPLGESYIVGNFLEATLPQGEFSFIEIDPPYGIDLEYIKRGDVSGYTEVEEEDYVKFLQTLVQKCTLAAAQDCYAVLWAPPQWYNEMYSTLVSYGWDVDHVPAIWFKPNTNGQSRAAEYWLSGVYEPFLYAKRGRARLHNEGRSNTFVYPVVHPTKKIHPTQKPIELMRDIITTFCHPGGTILVPFAGSGVTLAAAHDLGHSVVGYDVSAEYREEFLTMFAGSLS